MDKRAFVEILERHRDRVFSYALYCLRHRDDAEDVTQEAFLRLWQQRRRVDPQRVEAWLIRVARNLCIDRARRRRLVRERLASPDARLAAEPAALAADVELEGRLQLAQTRAELLEALGTLNEETRSAMILHYFQGLKIEEIAGLLGKKTSTVKVQLHRARRRLRRVLERLRDRAPVAKRETV